eukprot:Clim_evm103s109 gene=Clim_evmTU103s109
MSNRGLSFTAGSSSGNLKGREIKGGLSKLETQKNNKKNHESRPAQLKQERAGGTRGEKKDHRARVQGLQKRLSETTTMTMSTSYNSKDLELDAEEIDQDRRWYYDDQYDMPQDEPVAFSAKTKRPPNKAGQTNIARWEASRIQSGLSETFRSENDSVDDEQEQRKPQILVRGGTLPGFLSAGEGKPGSLSNALPDPVYPIKDTSSDFATLSRQKSEIVQNLRRQRMRKEGQDRDWKLDDTKLGNLIGAEYEQGCDYDSQLHGEIDATQISKSLSIREQRESLPVYQCKYKLLQVIRDNQVVVVVGETGSGKTTQMTQYLLEDGYGAISGGQRRIIGCTQPRRVAAMSVAGRVSEEMGVELGAEVGYTIRFEDMTSEKTLIKYMTDGIMMREALMDEDLERYSVIIMDEAHERSLNTDVLFGILRSILQRRRDLKLVVTSATLNAQRFSEFFGHVPIFEIPGRTYPVDIMHSRSMPSDYVRSAVTNALTVHLSTELPGDILIFMTGQEDVEATCQELKEKYAGILATDTANRERIRADSAGQIVETREGGESNDEGDDKYKVFRPKLLILPIYSQLPQDLQTKVFAPTPPNTRKCIVATNVAETSLTVSGIRYVIDPGLAKVKVFHAKSGMDVLQVFPITQASAMQRAGRAGRTGPGKCYRLYTQRMFEDEQLASPVPEIQRTDLVTVVLLLKSLGITDLQRFDFMDPPPVENLRSAMYQLWVLGALDGNGRLTNLGRNMVQFPVEPSLAKVLVEGKKPENRIILPKLLTIVAMLTVPPVWHRPRGKEEAADAIRERFQIAESDHLTLVHVYESWLRNGQSSKWARKMYLEARQLQRAKSVRDQLEEIVYGNRKHAQRRDEAMLDVNDQQTSERIRKIICGAYFHHAARQRGNAKYVSLRTGAESTLHPTSGLFALGFTPDYIVYHELLVTARSYIMHATAVEPEWLCREGHAFYALRRPGQTREEALALVAAADAERNGGAGCDGGGGGGGDTRDETVPERIGPGRTTTAGPSSPSASGARSGIAEIGGGPLGRRKKRRL